MSEELYLARAYLVPLASHHQFEMGADRWYGVVLILTRASVVLGDVLVIGVTWYKTYNTWKTAASVAMKASFSTMLLRDGASRPPLPSASPRVRFVRLADRSDLES